MKTPSSTDCRRASPLVSTVLNNHDLNQVTGEQRVMAGDPKFPGSQRLPDFKATCPPAAAEHNATAPA
ncbi:MAG: hypothetical protein WD294_11495 [Phycisphaeraceae bacterium]